MKQALSKDIIKRIKILQNQLKYMKLDTIIYYQKLCSKVYNAAYKEIKNFKQAVNLTIIECDKIVSINLSQIIKQYKEIAENLYL